MPLCLSHEGYKQPQQLLVLSYFLSIGQTFDLVVNIDGFNEVALSSLNHQRGLDISMPSAMHLDPLVNLVNQATLTPEKLQSLAAISQYKERINYLVGRLQRNRIAAINFVLERLHRSATASYQAEVARFSSLPSNPSNASLILATPSVTQRDEATALADAATELVRSVDADADDARGARRALLPRPAAEPVLHDAIVQRGRSQGRALGCLAVQDKRREGLSGCWCGVGGTEVASRTS